MELTKETIQKIEELVIKGEEPKVVEILGRTYCTKHLNEYYTEPKRLTNLSFNDLDSLIRYVEVALGHSFVNRKVLVRCEYDEVTVCLEADEHGQIFEIARAKPMLPKIHFDSYLNLEEFIIQSLTKFEQTDNAKKLVELLSKFQVNQTVETTDDGVSQRIVVSTGTGLNEKVQVTPIVRLTAFRTFREVKQIETLYLLRINKDGRIALFEADGGAWKEEATNRVRNYLIDCFADEKFGGKVVVL